MNVNFEEGEVLVLLTEYDRKPIGVAGSLEGFSTLIEETLNDDDYIVKWVHTTEDDCIFNIDVTILFNDGDQRNEGFIAKKYNIYS